MRDPTAQLVVPGLLPTFQPQTLYNAQAGYPANTTARLQRLENSRQSSATLAGARVIPFGPSHHAPTMDMDGFTSQDSFDAIRSAGSHFNDSFYPHSPASRTDEEIELLRNSEVGIPPQLTFDLGGSLLDFTPSTENDDRVRVGNLNGHLLTAQDGPLRLSESTKSWVYVDTISTVSSDFVNLTPRTRSPSLPLRSPPSEPHVPEEPRPVVGPRQTWQLPQKVYDVAKIPSFFVLSVSHA